jgi:hypothetical protein
MRLIILLLLILISHNSFSQKRTYIDSDTKRNMSYIMIGSGVSLSIISVSTPLEWSRDSNGMSYTKPFHENPAHFAGLLSGVGVSVGGIFTMITNKGNGKRKN